MIIVRCLFLMLFATCFYGSNALAADFAAPLASHNFFTPELKPSPDAFKIAKSTWLPDSFEDLGLSGRHNTKYDFNKNDCSSYPLKTCPSNGKCTKCPVGAGYKLDSCNTGYTKTGNTCRKKVEFCKENATTFKNNIPTDYVCSKITTNSLCNSSTQANCDKCYSSCYKINCSSYPLDCQTISKTALHIATTEICPNCKNSTISKCAKAYCKITECESGYKVNAAGTACIEKDDTCPNGYYKSCETGTQGTPQYTEKGTACYQCKPKTTENMLAMLGDILYSDMTTGSPENHAASGKKAIGVVVYDGLALALNKSPSTLQWGSGDGASKHNPYLITCIDPSQCKTSGKQATDNILKYGAENNYSFPAAEYCNDYIVPGTSAGAWWHLPSIAELGSATYSSASDARRVVNDTLSLVGGQILGDNDAYWTSDEAQSSGAYMLLGASQWKKPYTSAESLKSRWFSHGKYESAYVRPFINYKVIYTPLPVLYSDLTASREIIENKDPIGVVFDEKRRRAVALDEKALEWNRYLLDTAISTDNPLDDFDGAYNTQYYWESNLCSRTGGKDCAPFDYAVNYIDEQEGGGQDWYLPAYGELNGIFKLKNDINETLALLNRTPLSENKRYWSSTQTTGELGMYQLDMSSGLRAYSDEFGGAVIARAVINY